jgi:hypothetical protein
MSRLTASNGKAARYDADFYKWANEQAAALRAREFESLDFENLAEEVEGLAKSDRRELRNRTMRVLAHLLKCEFQTTRSSRSWEATLVEQRAAIDALLEDSPSLRGELPQMIERVFASAKRIAAKEMRLERGVERFPQDCPWTIEQVLDPDFYPHASKSA